MNLLLMRAMYWFRGALESGFAAMGLPQFSRAEAFVIVSLAMGEQRAINIAKNLGVSRQAISQVLASLEERGFVKVKEDPKNRRARIIKFSAAFEKHSSACHQLLSSAETELASRIGAKMVAGMRDALEAEWGNPPRMHRRAAAKKSERTRDSRSLSSV